jgi:hypothetical protein
MKNVNRQRYIKQLMRFDKFNLSDMHMAISAGCHVATLVSLDI